MEDLFEPLAFAYPEMSSCSSSIPKACSICLRLFNHSAHHLCALQCGHMFGLSCIEKLAEEKLPPLCPHCNTEFEVTQVFKLFIPQHDQIRKILWDREARISLLEEKERNQSFRDLQNAVREINFNLSTLNESVKAQKETITRLNDLFSIMHKDMFEALLVKAVRQIVKEETEPADVTTQGGSHGDQGAPSDLSPGPGVPSTSNTSVCGRGRGTRGRGRGFRFKYVTWRNIKLWRWRCI